MFTSAELWQTVKTLGIQFDYHESDLYIPVCGATRELIKKYEHRQNVTVFRSEKDGKQWYDIPFAFMPYWETRNQLGLIRRVCSNTFMGQKTNHGI